jgi:hypothetical protein
MHYPKSWPIVLLPLLIACTDPIETAVMPLSFQEVESEQPLPSVLMTGEHREITIEGRYLGMSCGSIGAAAEQRGSTITVRVAPLSNVCDAATRDYAYRVILFWLNRGDYTVRVRHRTDEPGHAEFSQVVTVLDSRFASSPGAE